jgi:hypothetical protein
MMAGRRHRVEDVADARPRVQPAPQHVPLWNVGRKEGADEGGGEEGVLTGPIRHSIT